MVETWALMIPLAFFASNGVFWFQAALRNNPLSSGNGALVNTHHFQETLASGAVVFSIVAAVVFTRVKSAVRLLRIDRIFMMLGILAMASAFWSQSPFLSLRFSLFLVFDTLFMFYLSCRFSEDQQIQLVFLLGWLCVSFSVILSLAFPAFGIDHTGGTNGAWMGMYGQKNMGAMATLYLLPVVFFLPSKTLLAKVVRGVYVLLSIVFIVMSQSKSSLVALILLFIFVLAMQMFNKFTSKSKLVLLFVGAMIVLPLAAVTISYWQQIAYWFGKDPTLTGRTEIWKAVMVSIMKHPLLGYGYQAFWEGGYTGESANVSFAAQWGVTSAHNGFLEVCLELGIIGMGLVLFSIVRAIWHACICCFSGASPYVKWCCCIIFVTIVFSFDESELMIPNNLMWALFMLACIGLSVNSKSIRLDQSHG
jgi:O-antigen ligase